MKEACLYVVVTTILLMAFPASATPLPSYLDHGLAVETLDPAPAGDRFVAVPDAYVQPGFAARVVIDASYQPLDLTVGNNTVLRTPWTVDGHIGLAGTLEWLKSIELSVDLPVVYEMRTDLSSASGVASDTTVAPATASLGDLRMGLRYAIPLQSRDGELNVATALDVWTPSNYVDVPVG